MLTLMKKDDVIKRISARAFWSKGARNTRIEEEHMSPFIGREDVLEELSRITGYELSQEQFEQRLTTMRVDIVCKDINTGDIVVIENQLEDSNHDHLGKCFTYLANLDAKAVIWICESFKEEHLKAIEKLNEITPDDYCFYALELVVEELNNGGVIYSFNKRFAPSRITKLANQVRTRSESTQAAIDFCEALISNIKSVIPSAHFNKGKQFHKIFVNQSKHIYFGITSPASARELTFDIESRGVCTDDDIAKLDAEAKKIENTFGYRFDHKLGDKNKSIHRWRYNYVFSEMPEKELLKCETIIKNIYSILKTDQFTK